MEGYSRFDCINAQRQLDVKYYDDEKRNRQPPPRISQPEPEVKRLKAASDNNREQDKSPERNANGERRPTNDEVVQRYFNTQMAKITIDGDDETYEARVNQADMDEEEPNEKPSDNITDVMTKSVMGTSTNALDSRLAVADNGKHKRMQMDSGCCGMSMLSSPAYLCYGLADGKKVNIHTAEKGATRKAKAYGIAAGSVPALTDLETRKAGPRKAIRTGLAVLLRSMVISREK
jgi:hypothetical protein